MAALAPLQALDDVLLGVFAVFSRPRAIFFRKYVLAPSMRLGAIAFVLLSQGSVSALAIGYVFGGLVGILAYVLMLSSTLRADGILTRASRRQARQQARQEARARRRRERDGEAAARTPDPAQVLSELRTLLTPLLPEPADPGDQAGQAEPDGNHQPGAPAIPHPRPGGLAAMESMLAGAELLMVGCGEEEAW